MFSGIQEEGHRNRNYKLLYPFWVAERIVPQQSNFTAIFGTKPNCLKRDQVGVEWKFWDV
jgi:hypothetical protein